VIQSRTVLISGSSGLIGTSLTDALRRRGAEVRRLVRRPARYADEFEWDPYSGRIDGGAMKGVDVVVNLSGANIGEGRWTRKRRQVLSDSRVVPTRLLAETMREMSDPPSTFISQSAIGIYGDRGDEILTEGSDPGPADDFLASLTVDWEAAAAPARDAVRLVHPRTGLVLASGSPAPRPSCPDIPSRARRAARERPPVVELGRHRRRKRLDAVSDRLGPRRTVQCFRPPSRSGSRNSPTPWRRS
jgi:nucleoside-diphosphate-sugar epimerase